MLWQNILIEVYNSKGIGEIVAKGDQCSMPLGQAVGYMKFGAFAEYIVRQIKVKLATL